jgi:hypothetical protein
MKGKRKYLINASSVAPQVRAALTSEWQSARMIACQVDVPPDAIARRIEKMGDAVPTAKTWVVSNCLKCMASRKDPAVEKRRAFGHTHEYRLIQKDK